jgi:hypothetical protein
MSTLINGPIERANYTSKSYECARCGKIYPPGNQGYYVAGPEGTMFWCELCVNNVSGADAIQELVKVAKEYLAERGKR